MRVIAGSARSVPLKAPKASDTRPTTDRIKETLFNILQRDIPGCVFVDIFAGSGAIGIEALSRGAEKAVFIDSGRDAVDIIKYNLNKCRLSDRARVIRADAVSADRFISCDEEDRKLIIFMDPPYRSGAELEVLSVLGDSGSVGSEALIIIEQSLDTDSSALCGRGFEIIRVKKYKTQKHVFLQKCRAQDEKGCGV